MKWESNGKNENGLCDKSMKLSFAFRKAFNLYKLKTQRYTGQNRSSTLSQTLCNHQFKQSFRPLLLRRSLSRHVFRRDSDKLGRGRTGYSYHRLILFG